MKKPYTLCIVRNNPRVLLGIKKRGFGEGRWNGFGGKVRDGESVDEALRRETKEEVGIELGECRRHGILEFEFIDNPEILEVHVFSTSEFSGEPTETEEMRPEWFEIDEIPYEEMWPDDKHWLPLLFEGKKFNGRFLFEDTDTLLEYDIKELD